MNMKIIKVNKHKKEIEIDCRAFFVWSCLFIFTSNFLYDLSDISFIVNRN